MHNFNQSINFFYQHSQGECAQMGLKSHARCHPTGVYDPYSFRIVMLVTLCPTRTDQ